MCRWPIFVALLLSVAVTRASAATPPEAVLVVVADQHSAYDRTAQLVARVAAEKAANPGVPLAVLIDGDTFELGNVVAKRSAGAVEFAMFAALARLAPTVLNLGNHEPEFYDLAETVARVRATGVTVIGNARDHASGQLFTPSSTRVALGGRQVVIAGFATDLLAQYRAAVRPSLDLANPVVWAKRELPALLAADPGGDGAPRSGGDAAPVRIVLSHAGVRYDREILPLVPDGTLFAGAHDHVRFVHRTGRTVYFHSGSWNGHVSVVRLRHDAGGPVWDVEQVALTANDPADPALAETIRQTRAEQLMVDDVKVIGHLDAALDREAAARRIVAAVRTAAGADAAFIGNTTFGDGLPAGDVSRVALDACVRFDGVICVAEVTGGQLREWLAGANPGPDTPFAARRDEFLFADGPAEIVPEKTYRIATTDWGMKNRGRYFGDEALRFTEKPELRLKAIVAQRLNQP